MTFSTHQWKLFSEVIQARVESTKNTLFKKWGRGGGVAWEPYIIPFSEQLTSVKKLTSSQLVSFPAVCSSPARIACSIRTGRATSGIFRILFVCAARIPAEPIRSPGMGIIELAVIRHYWSTRQHVIRYHWSNCQSWLPQLHPWGGSDRSTPSPSRTWWTDCGSPVT